MYNFCICTLKCRVVYFRKGSKEASENEVLIRSFLSFYYDRLKNNWWILIQFSWTNEKYSLVQTNYWSISRKVTTDIHYLKLFTHKLYTNKYAVFKSQINFFSWHLRIQNGTNSNWPVKLRNKDRAIISWFTKHFYFKYIHYYV